MPDAISAPSGIAITGAGGFIGRALLKSLAGCGKPLIAVSSSSIQPSASHESRRIRRWTDADELTRALDGAGVVVHAAGAAHGRVAPTPDAMTEGNVKPAMALATACRRVGVQQVVLISSASVYGTGRAMPFTEEDAVESPDSATAYGWSKRLAERCVVDGSADAGARCVVLRAPMVYGPGMRGNPAVLLRAVVQGIPLPLARALGPRSVLAIANLATAVRCAIEAQWSSGTYNVADPGSVSMREFALLLGSSVGKPARLWPLPVGAVRMASQLAPRAIRGRLQSFVEAAGPFVLSIDRLTAVLSPSRLVHTRDALLGHAGHWHDVA